MSEPLHIREHEFGPKKPRIRVWTDTSNGFEVKPYDEIKAAFDAGTQVIHHHCDGQEDCGCQPIPEGQFEEYVG